MNITWGIDGFGVKHYLCSDCHAVFGPIDIDQISHDCVQSIAINERHESASKAAQESYDAAWVCARDAH